MKLSCFIPTKNRPTTQTYKMFEDVGIKVYHFVEPQDYNIYEVPNKVSIEQNNKGITYVRNYMLKYAKNMGLDWVIFCDDDISHFGKFDGKTKKSDANIWYDIYNKVKKLPFEIAGINFRQYAWSEKTTYSINKKFVHACILMNVSRVTWEYKENTKEDRDFQLQAIKYGAGVLRFNHYFYDTPNLGSNAGGLHEQYETKKDKVWAINLAKTWRPHTKLFNKKGRIDCKVNIKKIAEQYKKTIR